MYIREALALLPLLILVFWIGVYPAPFLDIMHASVEHLLQRVNMAGGMEEINIAKSLAEVAIK
jgi:NADH-quinone oxidoreductase subunit M